MTSKVNNSTKHGLTALLAQLSEEELFRACLCFAQRASTEEPRDWHFCLQGLKTALKGGASAVSNINKLKEKPDTELTELLFRFIRREKFFDHTIRILKCWILIDKILTITTFLDAAGIDHTIGKVKDNAPDPSMEDYLRGIQAIQITCPFRDVAIYLHFILNVWSTSRKDSFWKELPKALKKSEINFVLDLPMIESETRQKTDIAKNINTTKKTKVKNMPQEVASDYYQRILFGSPGTGKSHRIINEILPNLNIKHDSANVIKTVFHPEYTYGDFVGKLLPVTNAGKVEYRYYAGHFAQALAQAYKNILSNNGEGSQGSQKVALIIDEINRGNSSAIFGTAFQLLDREDDGWSSYSITLSELEFVELLKLIGLRTRMGIKLDKDKEYVEYDPLDANHTKDANFPKVVQYCLNGKNWVQDYNTETNRNFLNECKIDLATRCVRIPPNLSIIGSMNTSDNSIYFMDSAFKRRWGWEFIDWDEDARIPAVKYLETLDESGWKKFVRNLNVFLKSKHEYIRGIEDKQIGNYFIKNWINGGVVPDEFIRNKLMFFVWDSVFQRDKKPLLELLNKERNENDQLNRADLVTFGDFCRYHNEFVNALLKYSL